MNVLLVLVKNEAVRESLRAALPEDDVLVFEGALEEAARRLVTLQADAILVDDGPGLGAEAIAQVKALAPGVPVIAVSTRTDPLSQATLVQSGADTMLPKPFSQQELAECLSRLTSAGPVARGTQGRGAGPEPAHNLTNPYQMALRWLSRASAHSDDPVRLSHSIVESALDIFGAGRCAVLLECEGRVRVAASQGISEEIIAQASLSYTSGLMRWFDARAALCDVEDTSPEAAKEMRLFQARLAAPFLRGGRVFGAVLLGDKANGLEYLPADRELLTLVVRAASMAFERAGRSNHTRAGHGQLREAFDSIDVGLVLVDQDRRILSLNPTAEALFRVRAREVVGESVQRMGSSLADVALRTLREGKPQRREVRDPAVGEPLELRASPLAHGGAAVLCAPAAQQRVASADIADSPFWQHLAGRVAQEIKNPMVAINTFAQLLPRKYDTEDFRDAFSRVVQQEVARINGVVETLFAFAENPQLSLRPTNLNESVSAVLARFERELAARHIRVEAELDENLPQAEVDPEYFTQAVTNVVQNSIDAMPEGGRLSVRTMKQDNGAEIRIEDSGPGVPSEDAEKVFLPFYSSRERGMGLGLTTANRILKQHQGDLKLVVTAEGGTCFSMRLPTEERVNEG